MKSLRAESKVTATKMAEQTQIQQVTMKGPKKVKAGKTLAEWNHRKRAEHAQSNKAQNESKVTYYGAGAFVAIGALFILRYYIYQLKKDPKETQVHQTIEAPVYQPKKTPAHNFEMD